MANNSIAKVTQVGNCWEISGDMLITTVNKLLKQSQALTMDNTKIDFANVTDVDTAAVSLILEWKRQAKNENQSLTLINFPANLTSLVQLYDVAEVVN